MILAHPKKNKFIIMEKYEVLYIGMEWSGINETFKKKYMYR